MHPLNSTFNHSQPLPDSDEPGPESAIGIDDQRAAADDRFAAIAATADTLTPSNPAVRWAIAAHAVNMGAGAGLAFGLGRSVGAGVADLITRAAFQSPPLLGVGPDTADFQRQSAQQAGQMLSLNVTRWMGAAIGGGLGSAASSVIAPRVARWMGGQFVAIPPAELVPDHVAVLIAADGQRYGMAGVQRLRDQASALQRRHGPIGGAGHVHAGQVFFGVVNALRGLGQGQQPMGPLPDIAVSTTASATAGAATGAHGAFTMATLRLQLPDARHLGSDPAPLVDMPLFQLSERPAPPARFSGASPLHTVSHLARSSADRVRRMALATVPLGGASFAGTVISATVPPTPAQVAHRVIQGVALGGGVAAAVHPWFEAQAGIAANDAARRTPTSPIDVESPSALPR